VIRLILVVALCAIAQPLLGPPAFAQADDRESGRQQQAEALRERAREARERAQELEREARELAQQANREARELAQEANRKARELAQEARREARDRRWEGRGSWEIRGRDHDGVHFRLLRSYTLPAGEVSHAPIVVVGGSATIDGRAEDDVVVIGGSLKVGPTAVILGEAVSVGGAVTVAPGATIEKGVDETVVFGPGFDFGWPAFSDGWWAAASFAMMIGRLGVVLFFCLMITWLAPGWTTTIGSRLSDAAGWSLVLGLTSQLLFVPALILLTIVLVITIVGIPLLLAMPFLLLFFALAWTAGFAAVVTRIGGRIRGQAAGASTSPTMDLLIGFAAVSSISVIGHLLALGSSWMGPAWLPLNVLGWLIEWAVWTAGLGAVLSSYMGRRDDPPAIPFIQQPSPSTL
jgi:acetyltransferase-like isoleucine patch superfamily enzyme